MFGIRPEDIYDRLFAENKRQDGNTLKARVEVVEPMGSELIVYLSAGKHEFVARFPPQVKLASHQAVELVFNLDKVHLFDRSTGKALF